MALARCFENLALKDCVWEACFVLGLASGSDVEAVVFFTVGTGAAGSRYGGHATTADTEGQSVSVRSQTIDRVVTELGVTPDLVKRDVQGAELEALQGARELAMRTGARFMVEMHSPSELPLRVDAERVLGWCEETSHAACFLMPHTRLHSADQISHRGRCHLLLIPAAGAYLPRLCRISEDSSIEQGDTDARCRQGSRHAMTSLIRSCHRRVLCTAEKSLMMRSRDAWPNVPRRVASSIKRAIAAASSRYSPGETNSPLRPFSMISGKPPIDVATMGNPMAAASTTDPGRPSESEGCR